MKKIYFAPSVKVKVMTTQTILAASGEGENDYTIGSKDLGIFGEAPNGASPEDAV